MGRLGYAYVVIHASLSWFVISASSPSSLEMMKSPLVGLDHVSNSTSSDSMIFSDMTTQSIAINDTSNTGLQVRCNGQKFGTPLSLPSCSMAISMIRVYDKEDSYGMRQDEGSELFNCALPYRWLSRKSPDCVCSHRT